MKSIFVIGVLTSAATLAGAQATFNPSNSSFTCPPGKSAFCASDSLKSNIIIRCHGALGTPGNCNDNLAGVPPGGVKLFAPCWQCSPTAGDASCSYNGTVYPDTGTPFTIAAGNASCNTPGKTTTFTSPSTPNFTPGANSSISAPTNKPLPMDPAPGAYSSVSVVNNQASATLTTTTTIPHTVEATISLVMPSSVPIAPGSGGYASGFSSSSAEMVMPSSVPIAPGSGGYASGFSSSSAEMVIPSSVPVAPGSGGFASYAGSNVSTGMMVGTSVTPVGTTQTLATGGSGLNGTSSPIPVYSSDGNTLAVKLVGKVAAVLEAVCLAWYMLR